MIDWQSVATWGWTVVCGLLGWLMRELWSAVKKLREDLSELEKEIPKEYVSKVDLQPILTDIRNFMARLEVRMDKKQDRHD